MPLRPLRKISLPDATEANAQSWLDDIEHRLSQPDCDRNVLCRDTLTDLFFPGMGSYDELLAKSENSPSGALSVLSMDPRNITLEHGISRERVRQLEARLVSQLRDYFKENLVDFEYYAEEEEA